MMTPSRVRLLSNRHGMKLVAATTGAHDMRTSVQCGHGEGFNQVALAPDTPVAATAAKRNFHRRLILP